MISPVIPMVGLSIFIGGVLLTLDVEEDISLELSLADNISFYHEAALRSGFEKAGGTSNPYTSLQAVPITDAQVSFFADMGGWESVGFKDGTRTYFLTYASSENLKYDDLSYERAMKIAASKIEDSATTTFIGRLDASGGVYSVADEVFNVSSLSLISGSPAILSYYEGL